jgi:hypothetical protein
MAAPKQHSPSRKLLLRHETLSFSMFPGKLPHTQGLHGFAKFGIIPKNSKTLESICLFPCQIRLGNSAISVVESVVIRSNQSFSRISSGKMLCKSHYYLL